MIEKKKFGVLSDGRDASLYTLKNKKGESVVLLDYGASIHSINVLDQNNELGDVVLGGADIRAIQGQSMEGSVIGRCANRIAFGRYEQGGKTVQLECNRNGHFLHGASGNYAHKLFTAKETMDDNALTFTYYDTGEGGFDCAVDVAVTYSFDDNSALQIYYDLFPHEDTVLCPTNHAYFNLSGGDIREHEMRIAASQYAAKGGHGMPDGTILPVEETPLDFRNAVAIGAAMAVDGVFFDSAPPKYDDSLLLDGQGYRFAAALISKRSGRKMAVYTDMPCIVFFTPYHEEPKPGKGGTVYEGYCAVCLETQFVPNAVNCPAFASPLFKKGQRLQSKTVYQFSIEKAKE